MPWMRSAVGFLFNSSAPLALFAASEPGIWFDPSDIGTLFQDNLGTTPITAPGQPVGLLLDKSKSLALGPELLTNGNFSNGTANWTPVNSTLSATAGVLTVTSTGLNYGIANQVINTVPGTTYKVTATVSVGTANAGWIIYAGTVIYSYTSTTPTVKTGYFVATNTTTSINIQTNNTINNGTVLCGGISVKAIAGNHATQATSTQRPIYVTNPGFKTRNVAQYSSDLSNAYWFKSPGASIASAGVNTPLGNPAWTVTYSTIDSTAAFYSANRQGNAGETWTFSCWIKAGTAPSLVMRFQDADQSGVIGALTVTPTTSWVRYSTTVTLTHSGSFFNVQFRGSTVTAGTVLIGDIQWELASTALAYQKQTAAGSYSETAVRNLANGSADVTNASSWVIPTVQSGVTTTKVGAGIDTDGLPYVDYRFQGTTTGTSVSTFYSTTNSRSSGTSGTIFTASLIARVISGTTTGITGFRVYVVQETAPSTFISNTFGNSANSNVDTISQATTTLTTGNQARTDMQLVCTSGVSIDITYRIKALQFELGTDRTAYQFNYSQYNVTESGLTNVYGLYFDGVDDYMATSTVTPGTDAVQVFSGFRKLSDAAYGVLAELGVGGTSGTMQLAAPASQLTGLQYASKGTISAAAYVGPVSAPPLSVAACLSQISTDLCIVRVNGSQAQSITTDQGTGNYLDGAIYIGRRGGASLPFNGIIYSLITRFGPNLSAAQITTIENYVNKKTGAY